MKVKTREFIERLTTIYRPAALRHNVAIDGESDSCAIDIVRLGADLCFDRFSRNERRQGNEGHVSAKTLLSSSEIQMGQMCGH